MSNEKLKYYWNLLLDMGVSYETLKVVTDINGFSYETLCDILFAVFGYRDFEQYERELYN